MEAIKSYIWIFVVAAFALLWVYGLFTMNSLPGTSGDEEQGAAFQGEDTFQGAEGEEDYLARMRAQEFSNGEISTTSEPDSLRAEVDLDERC